MTAPTEPIDLLRPLDTFARRHIGPSEADTAAMLASLGFHTLDELADATIPSAIRLRRPLALGRPRGEHELLEELAGIAAENRIFRSFLGMGYHDCIVPPVIQRNVLENPGWYTQYTPYQAEISQGRLEALLNFQTVVADLCALPLANASLLDEATAAAEAMTMCRRLSTSGRDRFFVSDSCHPQTIAVVQTRAEALGIEVEVGDPARFEPSADTFAVLLQYPATDGRVHDYAALIAGARAAGVLTVLATDLLALTLLRSPGELGADVAVGSAQRFGVPLGYGGPHPAFLATREENRRQMPGRVIGISKDAQGKPALRMALQTREQHIRRDKATSNICTAQVLLAVMAGMYAVYHGPEGLRRIAKRVHTATAILATGLQRVGLRVAEGPFFDTLRVDVQDSSAVVERGHARRINLRALDARTVCVALDEKVTEADLRTLLEVFAGEAGRNLSIAELASRCTTAIPEPHVRKSAYLQHPVFSSYHSEHEMLRYMHRLQARDLSLTTSMIPLGSCTMKLNGTSEMVPVTWPELGGLHPFVPVDQAQGYARIFRDLEHALAEITGLPAVSLQPNAGSQGEYAGLLVIRAYHRARGDERRDVCLIPTSAHGTNPASAILAGMRVVPVACDTEGNIDVQDLRAKAERHGSELAALMVTYPSTHGVFEAAIRDICAIVHEHGGQVYLDGANMNAQVGLCRPGDFGADVCHLNLHKTFCIPHGGGGPGMGPIAAAAHLADFLPGHPIIRTGGSGGVGAVSAAPWGSPSILAISWVYMALMGGEGLTRATKVAILNANYMARRLSEQYRVLYTGKGGRVGHEFILDFRPFEKSAGVSVEDVAKRLMDYGFHAPTMSFPVAGTLMIEPTESESRAELDRFCEALLLIREEIRRVEEGRLPREDNMLVNAPHTAEVISAEEWNHPYSRTEAAFPAVWLRQGKFWPHVGRVDNGYGDRHLVCTCPPIEAFAGSDASTTGAHAEAVPAQVGG